MIKITQTCDRDGKQRDLAENEDRRIGGWKTIEGFELCPDCVRELKVWLEAGKETDGEADDLQEGSPQAPHVCPHPGCSKAFGHELDPTDDEHGEGMYSPTTIQGLINALQTIGDKTMPVCVHDGMDMCLVHQLVVQDYTYWDGNTKQRGLILQIQGR